MYLVIHVFSCPWKTFRLNHLVINERALYTHYVILRLLSLDVVRSWTTAKDALTLIDLYHLLLNYFAVQFGVVLGHFKYRTLQCNVAKIITTSHLNFAVTYLLRCIRCSLVDYGMVYF